MRSGTVLRAVSIRIGTELPSARSRLHSSTPFSLGSCRSSTIESQPSRARRSPSSPSKADCTSKPFDSRDLVMIRTSG